MTGVVVNRPPLISGGPAADTSFLNSQTQAADSQLLADGFQLSEYATVRRVSWWGFYTLDNPRLAESIRIRVYNNRIQQDLPGLAAFESTIENPSRVATGRRVGVGILPREFAFSVDLDSPFFASPGNKYWIEITQLGDISTAFRWEFSDGGDRFAFLNANVPDWQIATIDGVNLALQLSTVPDPTTHGLIACGAILARRRR